MDWNVTGFEVVNPELVYVLDKDGNLWHTPGPFIGQV